MTPARIAFSRRLGLPRRLRFGFTTAAVVVAVTATMGSATASGSSVLPQSAAPGNASPGPPSDLTRATSKPLRPSSSNRLRRARAARARARAVSAPLVFGIYPGGAAGTVGPSGRTLPEDAGLRLQALQRLRGSARPFVLHLYDSFNRASDAQALPAWLEEQIREYTANGFQIELVLTYRPADPGGDVGGFTDFVRSRVRQLGPEPNVTSLQVTNEVNVRGAPDAADGAYPGARDALVRGVIAAKDEAGRGGHGHLRIGFNWAYQLGQAEADFFSELGTTGGRAFARSVDWVGLDAYPGTWGPALASGDLGAAVRSSTLDAIRMLRTSLLPLARLGRVPLHVSESGFPTGPGRTEAMQQTVMRAAVEAVAGARKSLGVTDYRWFDLRDADSASPSFESQYGITRDDYSPKAAFFTYRDLIARSR